jgi:hypothetical protein
MAGAVLFLPRLPSCFLSLQARLVAMTYYEKQIVQITEHRAPLWGWTFQTHHQFHFIQPMDDNSHMFDHWPNDCYDGLTLSR